MPQLTIIYGDLAQWTRYPYVTQQGSDPACGPFAIAFAFSCFLCVAAESQQFDVKLMRKHLHQCILSKQIVRFPQIQMTSSNVHFTPPSCSSSVCVVTPTHFSLPQSSVATPSVIKSTYVATKPTSCRTTWVRTATPVTTLPYSTVGVVTCTCLSTGTRPIC